MTNHTERDSLEDLRMAYMLLGQAIGELRATSTMRGSSGHNESCLLAAQERLTEAQTLADKACAELGSEPLALAPGVAPSDGAGLTVMPNIRARGHAADDATALAEARRQIATLLEQRDVPVPDDLEPESSPFGLDSPLVGFLAVVGLLTALGSVIYFLLLR